MIRLPGHRVSTSLILAIAMLLAAGLHAATRRALLVGIGEYAAAPQTPAPPFQTSDLRPKSVAGQPSRIDIVPLPGPVNDVESMRHLLVDRYDFQNNDTEIKTLLNREATADAILGAIRDFLVKDAAPNDIRIFYFAGHGSLIRNTATGEFDPTLVPYDALLGAPDIRSKELRRWFAKFLEGVHFVYIADSCHSGGSARGRNRYRDVPPDDEVSVKDPDPALHEQLPRTPEELGFLTLSATQANERAADVAIEERLPDGTVKVSNHGLFTWALVETLMRYPTERVDRVMERVRNLMASNPAAEEDNSQQPAAAGKGRLALDLLERKPDPSPAADARVRSRPQKDSASGHFRMVLSAGTVNNLFPGAKLKSVKDGGKTIVDIVSSSLYESEAELEADPPAGAIEINDAFKVSEWAAPSGVRIPVYVPPALAPAVILDAARRFENLPKSAAHVTHVLAWTKDGWALTMPDGSRIKLGPTASEQDVRAHLKGPARVSVVLPPTLDLAADLQQRQGAAFRITDKETDATYSLEGSRSASGALQYAWMLPADSSGKLSPYPPQGSPVSEKEELTTHALSDQVLRLGRIFTWLNFQSPAQLNFPYHLQLVDVTDKDHERLVQPGEELVENHLIRFDLKADDPAAGQAFLESGARVYVYVFLLNLDGQSCLFYPDTDKDEGGAFWQPPMNAKPAQFTLRRTDPEPHQADAADPCDKPDRVYDFCVSAPYGTDTYFMFASARHLPEPRAAFEIEGVRSGKETDLEKMISQHGTGTRGLLVPVEWKMEWNSYKSVDANHQQPRDNKPHPCR